MGYTTRYKLVITEPNHVFKHQCIYCDDSKPTPNKYCGECGKEIGQPSHEKEISMLFNEGYNLFEDKESWFTWENDMITYSYKYPNVVFQLSGEGESSGDIWRAYFKNGKVKVHKIEIVFDKYDEDELK